MRAVLTDASHSEWNELLERRRRLGHDRFDEMWEGELHVVPAPGYPHQRLEGSLLAVLHPIARDRGLVLTSNTGVYDPLRGEDDYRIPDLVAARPEHTSRRGVEGRAAWAAEVRSPNDETYQKLDFYARVGVEELLVVEVDVASLAPFVLSGAELRPQPVDDQGWTRSEALGVAFRAADGTVELALPDGTTATVP